VLFFAVLSGEEVDQFSAVKRLIEFFFSGEEG
jgi:hypothetical protein